MTGYVESIIAQHFKKTLWANPVGRINHYFTLKQFGQYNGEYGDAKLHKYSFKLPDQTNRYHLFQIGGLLLRDVNLSIDRVDTWVPLSDIAKANWNTIEFITNDGLHIPNDCCYLNLFENRTVIIAIRHLPNIVNLSNGELKLRISLNPFLDKGTPTYMSFNSGVYLTDNPSDYQSAYQHYETTKGNNGYTFVHINGVYHSKPILGYAYEDNDVFSAWYDSSIKGYFDISLKTAFSYLSKLDNVRKYLLHPTNYNGLGYNYWGNCDFVVGYMDGDVFKGIHLLNDTGKKIRMVTDRSWAIPVSLFETIVLNNKLFKGKQIDDLIVRVFIRQNDKALEYENSSHLKLLYSQPLLSKNITNILTGAMQSGKFWVCDDIENSPFAKIMRSLDESLTHKLFLDSLDYYSYRALLFKMITTSINNNSVEIYINDEFYNHYKPHGVTYISNGEFNQICDGNGFTYTLDYEPQGFEAQIHTSLVIEPNAVDLTIQDGDNTYVAVCPSQLIYPGKDVIVGKPTVSNNEVSFVERYHSYFNNGRLKDRCHKNKTQGNSNDVYRYKNAEKHVYHYAHKTGAWSKLTSNHDKVIFNTNTNKSSELVSYNLTAGDKTCVRLGNTGRFFYYTFNNEFNGDPIVINAHEGFSEPYDVPFNRVSLYAGIFDVTLNKNDVIEHGSKLIEGIDYVVKWPYIYVNSIEKLVFLNTGAVQNIEYEVMDAVDGYTATISKIKGLAVIIEGAVDDTLEYTPNSNYGFVVTINGKNYIQINQYQSLIHVSPDANINLGGNVCSVSHYIKDINKIIFSKTKKCFLEINNNVDDVFEAGTPFEINHGLTDYYENNYETTRAIKTRSDEEDIVILNILCDLTSIDDLILDKDIFINSWYRVYSPFMARILQAIRDGSLTLNASKVNDRLYVADVVEPYLRYLAVDPCINKTLSPFLVVYPTAKNSLIGVSETTFNFMSVVNNLYLNNMIEMKNCVTILKG